MTPDPPTARLSAALRLLLVLAAAALLAALGRRWITREALHEFLSRLQHLGPWASPAFIGTYVVACLLLLPASWLTLGAGAVFGTARGFVLVSAGSLLGACAAFLMARYAARGWVERRLAGDARLRSLDAAVAREGWKIVLLTRLSPLFPFVLLNYAFGLTRISLRHYALASWAGMIPGIFLYVSLGAVAGDLARLGTGGSHRSPAQWTLGAVGVLAGLAVTAYVARLASRALRDE